MRVAYPLLLLVALGAACRTPEVPVSWVDVSADSVFTLRLPDRLTAAQDMHEYASIQYYDPLTDFYVLGIEDAKANLGEIKRRRLRLAGYYTFVENIVFETVDTFAPLSAELLRVRPGIEAQVGDYYAYHAAWGETPLYYRLAVYESTHYYFQLVIWTPFEGACDRVAWMDSITYSLDFMDPAPE
ncbi:MAG: hypothetical protein SF053_15185 [Bacteroidia bacterium]|nr:hypothetical protein [Bacteroidia bacterium]